MTWTRLARIALKAVILFALCNVVFAATNALEFVNRISLYNLVVPGRERLPYGEKPASYNLSLDSIPAMFASHLVTRPKAADEYRVMLIGDSGVWGWLLEPDQTLAAELNRRELQSEDGRRMVFYNLAYPIQALLKDAMLLEEAMTYEPDAVIWFVTLDGFPRDKQMFPPLVQRNADLAQAIIARDSLSLDPADPRFVTPTFIDQTIVGARRPLADWLRLQLFGVSWSVTGIDQVITPDYPHVMTDLEANEVWNGIETLRDLTADDLAIEVLEGGAAQAEASGLRLLIVNEPIFISQGENADLRYNSWYPRWAYDSYRAFLADTCAQRGWACADLWDAVPPDEFTDSPVHLSANGTTMLAERIVQAIGEAATQAP